MSKATGVPGKTPDQLSRAQAAVTRQVERDQRSPEEQMALLDSRPGAALSERKRLASMMTSA